MNMNHSKLLTMLTVMAGFSSFSVLVTLPSEAKEALNPNPSIFNEAPYNLSQRLQVNAQYTSAKVASEIEKGNTKRQEVVQKSGKMPNPRPSIFNEPPYNRGGSATPSETAPGTPDTTPNAQPTLQPTEAPSTGTTPPGLRVSDNQGKNLLELLEESNTTFTFIPLNTYFTVLTKALKAAGLTGALQGKDNLTIFAPSDAAFAKLPLDTVQELLSPDKKEVLLKILTYHIVPGKLLSADLKSGEVKSLEGGTINVKVDPTVGVTVNDAKVIQADITGSNGVIHIIDQVILPPDF